MLTLFYPQSYYKIMWNISIVTNTGTKVYKFVRNGSGAYSLSDAIYQALHVGGLVGVTSVTATII